MANPATYTRRHWVCPLAVLCTLVVSALRVWGALHWVPSGGPPDLASVLWRRGLCYSPIFYSFKLFLSITSIFYTFNLFLSLTSIFYTFLSLTPIFYTFKLFLSLTPIFHKFKLFLSLSMKSAVEVFFEFFQ